MFILLVSLNWILKLFVAWLTYLLANWLQAPKWAMIPMIAIGAVESKLKF